MSDYLLVHAESFDLSKCTQILYVTTPGGLDAQGPRLKTAFKRVQNHEVSLTIEPITFCEEGPPTVQQLNDMCKEHLKQKTVEKPMLVIFALSVARGSNVITEEYAFVAVPEGKDYNDIDWAERGQEAVTQSFNKVKGFFNRNK